MLGIRTFDQIQAELSKRLAVQSQVGKQTEAAANKQMNGNDNPQESSYQEPLNLLKQFKGSIDKIYSHKSSTIDDDSG